MPESVTLECPNCHTPHRVEVQRDELGGSAFLETLPCQGSDDCKNRPCESCVVICAGCLLPACDEHVVDLGGERFCRICVAKMERDGLELCDQETAATISLLAEAGCNLPEVRAAMASRERRS